MTTIDPANAAQLEAWDGDEGAYWAAHADRFDRAVAVHHRRLLDGAAIADGDAVLDIGCGTGQTTLDAARLARAGHALGVDLSSAMLDVARRRAADEALKNVRFEQADAQVHPFDEASFDLAISRTGAMFFADRVAAFTNIARALRPDGRLVLVTWKELHDNEWIREISGAMAAGRDTPAPPPDAPSPFSLADPDRVRGVLGAAGYTDVDLEGFTAPMWFGDDADDAYDFVLGLVGWMVEGVDDATRERALDGLRAAMAAHVSADGVVFGSAAWLIRARRT